RSQRGQPPRGLPRLWSYLLPGGSLGEGRRARARPSSATPSRQGLALLPPSSPASHRDGRVPGCQATALVASSRRGTARPHRRHGCVIVRLLPLVGDVLSVRDPVGPVD